MKQEIKERIELINKGMVPAGYKKTPVGICPVEWKTYKISDIAQVVGGGTPDTKNTDYFNGDINWFTPTEIGLTRYVSESKIKITAEGLKNSAAKIIPAGNILLTSRATIGEMSFNLVDCSTNQGFQSLIIKDPIVKNVVYFNNYQLKKQMLTYANGSTFLEISNKDIKKLKINISNKKEENSAIVKILDCATRQVELQEQLVDKLKVQKKALMQKLLTPQPDWQEVKLGDICKITTGKLDANEMVENGKYPFFTCSKDIYKIDKYAYDMEALLMAGNGEIGDIKYYNGKFNAYQRTYILYNFTFNIKYAMQYLLLHFNQAVCKGSQKSSMPYIRVDLLNNAKILYPQNLDQIAIFLENFDKKIELQQKLLEQYKLRQKSLMQLLLTGIVRVC